MVQEHCLTFLPLMILVFTPFGSNFLHCLTNTFPPITAKLGPQIYWHRIIRSRSLVSNRILLRHSGAMPFKIYTILSSALESKSAYTTCKFFLSSNQTSIFLTVSYQALSSKNFLSNTRYPDASVQTMILSLTMAYNLHLRSGSTVSLLRCLLVLTTLNPSIMNSQPTGMVYNILNLQSLSCFSISRSLRINSTLVVNFYMVAIRLFWFFSSIFRTFQWNISLQNPNFSRIMKLDWNLERVSFSAWLEEHSCKHLITFWRSFLKQHSKAMFVSCLLNPRDCSCCRESLSAPRLGRPSAYPSSSLDYSLFYLPHVYFSFDWDKHSVPYLVYTIDDSASLLLRLQIIPCFLAGKTCLLSFE